jgi:hypothetical protein
MDTQTTLEVFEPMTAPNASNLDQGVVAKLVELLPQCPPGQGIWLSKIGFDPDAAASSKHIRDSYRKAVINALGVDKERVITSTRRNENGLRDIQIGLIAEDAPTF